MKGGLCPVSLKLFPEVGSNSQKPPKSEAPQTTRRKSRNSKQKTKRPDIEIEQPPTLKSARTARIINRDLPGSGCNSVGTLDLLKNPA